MVNHILYFLIEVAVQTVFLTVALWIMILIQKLNYRFPGLLGTAALVSIVDEGLNELLGHSLGSYAASSISTPFVLAVLYFCLKKLTQADRTDIYYTAGVGYALVFVMNLWLMGALMGNLRPSARHPMAWETNAPSQEVDEATTSHGRTNDAATDTTNAAEAIATVKTNAAAALANSLAEQLSVKGLVRNHDKSMVSLQMSNQTYNLYLGESVSMQTAQGPASVRFKELGENEVVVTVNGVDSSLATPY